MFAVKLLCVFSFCSIVKVRCADLDVPVWNENLLAPDSRAHHWAVVPNQPSAAASSLLQQHNMDLDGKTPLDPGLRNYLRLDNLALNLSMEFP
ncbi:hypothetical protein AEM42_03400 [Betaproteobacteria bacterium UKL13-2]|nr:hypothetical protein AEM42_03400 [Betaproteobacteria bacterium UKL13-2]HCG54536.1 hypothetical protein [Betaproteobacteria bacterium]